MQQNIKMMHEPMNIKKKCMFVYTGNIKSCISLIYILRNCTALMFCKKDCSVKNECLGSMWWECSMDSTEPAGSPNIRFCSF
jgi:hypothetical protein